MLVESKTTATVCARCDAAMEDGDRFCAACGGPARVPERTSEQRPGLAALLEPATLTFTQPFCRACGADAPSANCVQCGRPVGPVGPVPQAALATVHVFRRKLIKRSALRIGRDRLVFESGEIATLDPAELPEPAPPLVERAARTTQGELIRIAEALATGRAKGKWQPGLLLEAAIQATTDEATARALALDLLDAGRGDLIDRLPLTATEKAWARAVGGDAQAIGELPVRGYRPKLALILAATDRAPFSEHLAAYAQEEPIAALLLRTLQPSTAEATITGARAVLATTALPAELELDAALAALDGVQARAAGTYLPPHARALIAHATGAPGLVDDVDELPLAFLDDLIENGAVTAARASQPARDRYLRARLAPERLTDEEVAALEHEDERLRRAFRRHEELPGGHYAALDALRRNKPRQVTLEHVREQDRAIVERLLEPDIELTDELLADRTVWPVIVALAGSTGLRPDHDRFPAFAEWLALTQARDLLYLADWSGAVAAADRCLELAELEDVRDEALNLKACGLHHLGRDAEAVAALEQALEGAYSEGLLANMGIVATNLAPEIAARYLGRLIDEAPATAMRAAAAHRALTIWSQSDTSHWSASGDSPLPDAFRDALRRLVSVTDLALDDFRAFARVLANQDADWFKDARHLGRSPHRDSLEGRFFVARAGDLHAMIGVMGTAIAAGEPPLWLLHERDSLREAALEILFNNLDEPDSTFGSIALAMADNGVLATPYDHLLFTLLGIAGVSYHLSERDQEVGDRIVELVRDGRRRWRDLGADDQKLIEPMVELATRRVALNRMFARDREISQAINLFNQAVDRGQYAPAGSYQYSEAMRQIATAAAIARNARDDLLPWTALLDHAGARADIDKSVAMTRDLESRCLRILN